MRKLLILILVVSGLLSLCKGAWIPCKAAIAQVLLHRAWEKSLREDRAVRPWPWADTWPVARIIVPSEGIDQIVLEGESGQALAFGPGHVTDSSLPHSAGNTILVGHRDTSFSFLRNLKNDDLVILEAINGRRYAYSVSDATVMKNDEIYLRDVDEKWLTLITCYPFFSINPATDQRYVLFSKWVGDVN
jgi:sortase A